MMLPHGIFFKPNAKFLNTMASEYKDVGILEAGSVVGHVLKVVKEYGKNYGISAMSNIRGFDIHRRTEYEVPEFEIFMADALDLTVYHQRLQVLVCRPDHGGWVGNLLDDFLLGDKVILHVGKNEYEYPYEITDRHGEHFKLKSKYGIRFCRIWRISRMATDLEIEIDNWGREND